MVKDSTQAYEFERSLKSGASDELINTYLLRPIAGVLVKLLYHTPVTPNQLTVAAILVGFASAYCYSIGEYKTTVIAGLLVTLKDLLDSADGQLARAKNLFSRRGRFIDSIGDFLVNLFVFGAITFSLYSSHPSAGAIALGVVGLLGITLRVSYHVFYHVSYLHLEERYLGNRLVEEIRDEDRQGDPVALRLQRIFLLIYGWQDKLMYHLDDWSKSVAGKLKEEERFRGLWYSDPLGLRLSGLIGLGTELALLMVCSLLDELRIYLWLNLILMNSIWLVAVAYRKFLLAPLLVKRITPIRK